MKTKLPTTIKPACSALDEGENQNPLRLPWKSIGREFDGFGIVNCESGLVVECLTLNKMQRDAILNGVNEHAALVAVAEAAEIAYQEMFRDAVKRGSGQHGSAIQKIAQSLANLATLHAKL